MWATSIMFACPWSVIDGSRRVAEALSCFSARDFLAYNHVWKLQTRRACIWGTHENPTLSAINAVTVMCSLSHLKDIYNVFDWSRTIIHSCCHGWFVIISSALLFSISAGVDLTYQAWKMSGEVSFRHLSTWRQYKINRPKPLLLILYSSVETVNGFNAVATC